MHASYTLVSLLTYRHYSSSPPPPFVLLQLCYRVLQESLYEYLPTSNELPTTVDDDLAIALQLSAQEQSQHQQDLLREQEMFELALKLSLEEK